MMVIVARLRVDLIVSLEDIRISRSSRVTNEGSSVLICFE